MVTVIHLEEGFSIHRMAQEWIFDESLETKGSAVLTAEDTKRTLMYQQSLQRNKLLQTATSHTAFLSSLGVKITFEILTSEATENEGSSFARVLQLHQRTNQFNIATSWSRKLDPQMLDTYVRSERHAAFCAHVTDRFGHYGLVSVMLCRAEDERRCLRVDSFLLSCRALNRGVEHAMIRKIAEIAADWQLSDIELDWEPTERNEPTKVFFSSLSAFEFAPLAEPYKRLEGREEKLRASSTQLGSWLTTQEKAANIAFLQTKQPASSSSSIRILLSNVSAWWRSFVTFSIITLATIVPQWLWIVLGFGNFIKTKSMAPSSSVGLLRQQFGSIQNLNAFFTQYLPPAAEGAGDKSAGLPVADNEIDDDAMGKFRRKARHQSKLALLSHLHEENQEVIWSANRKPLQEPEAMMTTSVFTPAVCATSSCQSSASRQCDLLRCRNCCYKMQRLLTRANGSRNEHARQAAVTALVTDYGLHNVAIRDPWCAAHKNTRRRGGP